MSKGHQESLATNFLKNFTNNPGFNFSRNGNVSNSTIHHNNNGTIGVSNPGTNHHNHNLLFLNNGNNQFYSHNTNTSANNNINSLGFNSESNYLSHNNHEHGHDRIHNQLQHQHNHNHNNHNSHHSGSEINQFNHSESSPNNYLANLVQNQTALFPLHASNLVANLDAHAFLKNGMMQNGEYMDLSNVLSHSRGDFSV